MTIRRVRTVDGLSEPVGAFSQAIVADGFVYTSGQIPARADDSIPADFESQLEATLGNLRILLDSVGSGLEQVVKVNGYLTDRDQLDPYNRIYSAWFGEHLPARTTVCVDLWDVALEIDCVALVKEKTDD
jgi:2-iminobutanoate/2-iminopropanoate deaminase